MSRTPIALSMSDLVERFDSTQPLIPSELQAEREHVLRALGVQPVEPHRSAARWEYWVNYLEAFSPGANDALLRLKHDLLKKQTKRAKYFLTGQKGAGKSTQLNALRADPGIRERYHVIGYSIYDYLNLDKASSDQLVALLIANVIEAIQEFEPLAKLGQLVPKIITSSLREELRSALPGVKLDSVDLKLFSIASAKFKESENARGAFRTFLEGNPTAVLDMLDRLLGKLEVVANKEVLIIIDDLDKLGNPAQTQDFFSVNLPILLRPQCRLVYTYPIELERNPTYGSLKVQHGRYVMRNVQLFQDRTYRELVPEGRTLLTDFIKNRLEAPIGQYLDPGLLDRIFLYSCGNYRELARILYHCFDSADIRGKKRVDLECLKDALAILRDDYNPFLYSYRSTLQAVAERKGDDVDPAQLAPLLQSMALIEFPDHPGWLDVHPILADLLAERPSPRELPGLLT